MTELPQWIAAKLPAGARHPGLAIARLGDERKLAKGGFALSSPAFAAGEELDPCFTAKEEDAVAPPLEWSAPPPGAQEIVIIAEDASSEAAEPQCHWLVWGLPGQKGKLLEGETPPRAGKNAKGNSEWLLPNPPLGVTRHYVFQAFATELPLTTMPGATREDIVKAIEGQVTACALLHAPFTGTPEDDGLADEDF